MHQLHPQLTDRPAPDRLLTIADVADRLSVSRRTVYRLIADESLASLKLRGCARVRESALRGLLDHLEDHEVGIR